MKKDKQGKWIPLGTEIKKEPGGMYIFQFRNEKTLPNIKKHGLKPSPITFEGYSLMRKIGIATEEHLRRVMEKHVNKWFDKFKPKNIDLQRQNAVFFHAGEKLVFQLIDEKPSEVILRMEVDPDKTLVFDDQTFAMALVTFEIISKTHGAQPADAKAAIMPLAEAYWNSHVTLSDFRKYYNFGLFEYKKETDPVLPLPNLYMRTYRRKRGAPRNLPYCFGFPEVITNGKITPDHLEYLKK